MNTRGQYLSVPNCAPVCHCVRCHIPFIHVCILIGTSATVMLCVDTVDADACTEFD